ncbi:hypothetical protein VPH35_139987 [Triticum aestivum]
MLKVQHAQCHELEEPWVRSRGFRAWDAGARDVEGASDGGFHLRCVPAVQGGGRRQRRVPLRQAGARRRLRGGVGRPQHIMRTAECIYNSQLFTFQNSNLNVRSSLSNLPSSKGASEPRPPRVARGASDREDNPSRM